MFALRRIPSAVSSVRVLVPSRNMTVREAGGAFANREKSEEDRYTWEHEKEMIKNLRAQLAQKEAAAKKKLDEKPHIDPEFHKELNGAKGLSNATPAAGGDAMSKREAAAENRYIREQEAKKGKH